MTYDSRIYQNISNVQVCELQLSNICFQQKLKASWWVAAWNATNAHVKIKEFVSKISKKERVHATVNTRPTSENPVL